MFVCVLCAAGQHTVGKWRQQPNYLLKYDFVDTEGRRVRYVPFTMRRTRTSVVGYVACVPLSACVQEQLQPASLHRPLAAVLRQRHLQAVVSQT